GQGKRAGGVHSGSALGDTGRSPATTACRHRRYRMAGVHATAMGCVFWLPPESVHTGGEPRGWRSARQPDWILTGYKRRGDAGVDPLPHAAEVSALPESAATIRAA